MNLDQFSDVELVKELERRKEIKRQEELSRRQQNADFWISKVDLLLELIPNHCRTSCSDTNAINDERCTRCYLLCAKSCNFWDLDRHLNINIIKLPTL